LTTATRKIKITYERPWLYALQSACFFNDARISVIEASAKAGKTVGALAWLLEQAWMQGRDGHAFWWVAPVNSQSRIAYRRCKRGLPEGTFKSNDSEMTVTLLNGAVLFFKSADNPDSLYGDDVYAAVIDEASRCKEEAWHAVRSTLTATRGQIRIIGNVRGSKNWAYRLARQAETEEGQRGGLLHFRITAYDAIEAGVLQQDEIDAAKRDLPEDVFKELYEAIPSTDGGNPFGLDKIRKCIRPMSTERARVWGWDLAKAQDYTVGIGLDGEWTVSHFNRWTGTNWTETEERLIQETRSVPALVDSTGLGDVVLDHLQRDGNGRYEGFVFSIRSKQELMRRLQMAIHNEKVHFPPGPIVDELESFEYQYTQKNVLYSAPPGLHDDCVMALALAVYHATERRVNQNESNVIQVRRWV
jgi:hypothetical protein